MCISKSRKPTKPLFKPLPIEYFFIRHNECIERERETLNQIVSGFDKGFLHRRSTPQDTPMNDPGATRACMYSVVSAFNLRFDIAQLRAVGVPHSRGQAGRQAGREAGRQASRHDR